LVLYDAGVIPIHPASPACAGKTDERVVQAIHLTINGIAAGLRNSG